MYFGKAWEFNIHAFKFVKILRFPSMVNVIPAVPLCPDLMSASCRHPPSGVTRPPRVGLRQTFLITCFPCSCPRGMGMGRGRSQVGTHPGIDPAGHVGNVTTSRRSYPMFWQPSSAPGTQDGRGHALQTAANRMKLMIVWSSSLPFAWGGGILRSGINR